ncbi:MAG: hypothetical protein IPJ25_03995 [Rhodocyclaceae bacterium]|nr:hypothetical protein [Rhodocyclaceae bacterium]
MKIDAAHAHQRAPPKTRLRVRFQNGAEISEKKASDTFALALVEFGLDRVRELGKMVNGIPLISMQKHEMYTQYQSGRNFVMTHTNTKSKMEILEAVAKELGVQIKVEIIS